MRSAVEGREFARLVTDSTFTACCEHSHVTVLVCHLACLEQLDNVSAHKLLDPILICMYAIYTCSYRALLKVLCPLILLLSLRFPRTRSDGTSGEAQVPELFDVFQ